MSRIWSSAVFALLLGVTVSAQGAPASPTGLQSGPDLSGRWTRESAGGSDGRAASGGWGSEVEIKRSGAELTVQPASGRPQKFRLDGKETNELAGVDGCKTPIRITKLQADSDRVTITTWLVTTASAKCFHTKIDDCEELAKLMLEVPKDPVRGRRTLESLTVISRDGNSMTVESTSSTPGGAPTSTTTTYRK